MSVFHSLGQRWSSSSQSNKSGARGRKRSPQGKRGLRFETLEDRSMLATIVVTSLADNTTVDGFITLREALIAANTDTTVDGSTAGSGADTITFDPSLTAGGPATINLGITGDNEFGPSALLITSDVTIQGSTSANGITLARDTAVAPTRLRLFNVGQTGSLTLNNLTLTGGAAVGGNGFRSGGGGLGAGGAIVNQGTLTIRASTFSGNLAQGGSGSSAPLGGGAGGGGGMAGDAFDTNGGGPNGGFVAGSSGGFGGGGGVNGGTGGFGGGGGFNNDSLGFGGFGGGGGGGGNVSASGGFGGGNSGTGGASNGPFQGGGGAGLGGAIFNYGGTITITNSTLANNAAIGGNAGGNLATVGSGLGTEIFNLNGSVALLNVTLVNTNGGSGQNSIYNLGDNGIATQAGPVLPATIAQIDLTNSIINNNSGSDYASVAQNGGNAQTTGSNSFITNGYQPGPNFNVQNLLFGGPQLGVLANNGGPTQTILPLAGSPLIDAGLNASIPNGVTTDQRGFSRFINGTVDIGAVEFGAAAIVTAPTIFGPTATNIAQTTATLGGNVIADNGAAITERGIVYSITSLNNNPQIGGNAVTQLTSPGTIGPFTINVAGLPTGTQISFAAYATNASGTTYTLVGTLTTGITVQVANGVMTVTGTEQDDTITVAIDGMGGLLVTANKTINGLPSPQTFTGATSIVANTLGGNDDLSLAAPLTLNGVTVDLGNGNDRLVLGADPSNAINNNVLDPQFGSNGFLTVNGAVSVTGGEGDDRVFERSTTVNGVKTIALGEGNNEYNVYWGLANETIFSSGAGQDNVYIGFLSSREISNFSTGAGNDLISYYASRFFKSASLNSGAGADTVALDVNIYDDSMTVDTGSEADFLLFSRSIALKTVALTTGDGADRVLIGKYIAGLGSTGAPIFSNGGSNIDQLSLDTGAQGDTLQMAANVIRQFYGFLGDAYDIAEVEFNLFTDGLLDGGRSVMAPRLRGNANLRTLNPG